MKISKIEKITKISFISVLIVITFSHISNNKELILNSQEIYDESIYLKKAGYWIVDPFVIDQLELNPDLDYTWEEIVLEPWCSGEGTIENPYVIENIMINHSSSPFPTHFQSCIEIMYSDNTYFIIRNCTFRNAYNSVIKLSGTNKGLIFNNTFLADQTGILLSNSYNNSIIRNRVYNSTIIAIWSYSSGNNTISQNIILDSAKAIRVDGGAIISRNSILRCGINASANGEAVLVSNDNNLIKNNTLIESKDIGIMLYRGTNNTIKENLIEESGGSGILLYYCPSNKIQGNILKNNSQNGLLIEGDWEGRYNTVFNNQFINNTQRGVYAQIGSNLFYNNTFIGNGENANGPGNSWNYSKLGNYWDDYTGDDDNDDLIGDTPYTIYGRFLSYDYHPIWDDGPDLNITNPFPNEVFAENPPNFTVECKHPSLDTIWYTLNYNPEYFIIDTNATINANAWASLPEGNVTITFYANSTSGIIKSKEIIVIKDISFPELIIEQPTNSLVTNGAPFYSITISDLSFSSTWYTLDEGLHNYTITQFNGSIDQLIWSSQPDGPILLRFYAEDLVGHVVSKAVTITKDTQAPLISVDQPEPFHKYDDSPVLKLSILELHLASFGYFIDFISFNQSMFYQMSSLEEKLDSNIWEALEIGIHTLTFYARDFAGNIEMVEILIEKITPGIDHLIPGYNILFLIGIVSIVIILIRKYHKLN